MRLSDGATQRRKGGRSYAPKSLSRRLRRGSDAKIVARRFNAGNPRRHKRVASATQETPRGHSSAAYSQLTNSNLTEAQDALRDQQGGTLYHR